MVQNCNRKLPRNIDVRLNSNLKWTRSNSYAPATANQPTSPPSGGSFLYTSGGVGLKSYISSSKVSSKSSRSLCFFVSTNFGVLGVDVCGGGFSWVFLKGRNWASQLHWKKSAPTKKWLVFETHFFEVSGQLLGPDFTTLLGSERGGNPGSWMTGTGRSGWGQTGWGRAGNLWGLGSYITADRWACRDWRSRRGECGTGFVGKLLNMLPPGQYVSR